MNELEKKEQEEEIEMIWNTIFDAIPTGVESINILAALGRLVNDFSLELSGYYDDEDSREDNLDHTGFSKN